MSKKSIIYLSILFSSIVVTLFLVASFILFSMGGVYESKEPFEIEQGDSKKEIVSKLGQYGYFTPEFYFVTMLKIGSSVTNNKVKAGYYDLSNVKSNWQLFIKLLNSDVVPSSNITILPSYDIKKIASILEEKIGIDKSEFIAATKDKEIINSLGVDDESLEGYLYPDTYKLMYKNDIKLMLKKFVSRFKKVWEDDVLPNMNNTKLKKREILILASIVQGETSDKEEQKIVAGLYLNRLKIKMPLQADPTVQYFLPEKRRLTYNDYKTYNSYNTYMITGLPPGPVGNPAKNAILAVLKPANHDYLYMVAKGDGSGKHNFSKTLNQHNQFVAEYRKKLNN
jgi:UPF0755 protein